MQTFLILLIGLFLSPISFAAPTEAVSKWCDQMEAKYKAYEWGSSGCKDIEWMHVRNSHLGTPLIWKVFGEEKKPPVSNITLILCGVHGDEITPIKICMDLIKELSTKKFEDKLVVIAPLVAPDSFFIEKPSRTNGRGVDVNRNFPTKDWKADAHRLWKSRYKSDKRKNPGPYAASEQETIFQMNLIIRYKPNKVISVHSPLTILDYDGPTLRAETGKKAKDLLEEMSRKASGYKVSNYPHFPGSLGNWAGRERNIPTYTLELPNSNPAEAEKFWNLFKDAMIYAVDHQMIPTNETSSTSDTTETNKISQDHED